MTDDFRTRLNRIMGRITSDDFLANNGLGNEIGFWIFDYSPDHEMEMRSFIDEVLLPSLAKRQRLHCSLWRRRSPRHSDCISGVLTVHARPRHLRLPSSLRSTTFWHSSVP